MEQFGGGSWMMVSSPNSTVQDQFQQQQFQMHQQQFQVHQQQQQYQLQQQFQIHQQQQQQLQLQIQQQHQQQPQPQSLASHFQFLHLIESLAEAVESGTRDQRLDALVNELSNQFDKCQKLLNNISSSLDNKCVTVEGQKHKLEETEQLLNHRRELITKYRSSVQNLLNSDGSI